MLVFGTIMSFTTRGVNDNFNESRVIAFSVRTLLSSFGLSFPIARCTLRDLLNSSCAMVCLPLS